MILRIAGPSPASYSRCVLWLGLVAMFCVVGCAGRARMGSDPFRRPGGPGTASADDPRYDSGVGNPRAFDKANSDARAKDVSADVSTDPIRDRPSLADRSSDDQPLRAVGQRDPLLDRDDTSRFGESMDRLKESASQVSASAFEEYERLRGRLDKIGAGNWKFDRDPKTGKTTFRCEVKYPDNPSLFRVFEAESPDEIKAMLAVVEQVEAWVQSKR